MKKLLITLCLVFTTSLSWSVPEWASTIVEHRMGETPVTLESLAFNYANNYRGLVDWVNKHLRYSKYMQARVKSPKELLKDEFGDCEDFAILYYAVLSRGNQYEPVTVLLEGGEFYQGHFVCAIKDGSEIMLLSNTELIKTRCRTLSEVQKKLYPNCSMKIVDLSAYVI